MATKDADVQDERSWWTSSDDLEPLIGVPSVGAVPVPLPDTAADEPEPGIAPSQEDGEGNPEFEEPPWETPES